MNAPAKPALVSTRASVWLDLLRGVSAFAVLIEHWRGLSFQGYRELVSPGLLLKGFYFATSFGHQAVMSFFALSGFFVGGSVLRSHRLGTWSWGSYAAARLSRLLVVLWPALLLGALWDSIGTRLYPAGVYAADPTFGNVVNVPVRSLLTWQIGLGNAAFAQQILCPTFGSNGALWSLSNEFWYYVTFPVMVGAVQYTGWRRAAAGVGATLLLVFMGRPLAVYFPVWLAGAALALLPARPPWANRFARLGTKVSLLALAVALTRSRIAQATSLTNDYLVALSVTALIYFVTRSPSTDAPSRAFDVLAHGAGLAARSSYTLYLVHLPLLILLEAALHPSGRWAPTGLAWLEALGILCAVSIYAAACYLGAEARTPWLKARLGRWFGAPPVRSRSE